MKKKLHSPKTLSAKDVVKFLSNLKSTIEFFSAELQRQSPDEYAEFITSTEFDVNPIPLHQHNFTWRGNEQSLSVFYAGAVLKEEIFYAESEKVFRTHYGKFEPQGLFIVNKTRISEVVYLHRRLAAPDIKVLVPDYWHKILPNHFIDEFERRLKEGTIKTRASLALESCVRSEGRRKVLDAIINDVKSANTRK